MPADLSDRVIFTESPRTSFIFTLPSTVRKSAGSRWHILTISSRALSGNTIGFDETECAHIGVMHIPPRRGSRTGPPADSEYAEMLKLKDFYLERPITEEYLLAPDLLERTVEEFRRTQPFIAILNRAVQYAYDEMM